MAIPRLSSAKSAKPSGTGTKPGASSLSNPGSTETGQYTLPKSSLELAPGEQTANELMDRFSTEDKLSVDEFLNRNPRALSDEDLMEMVRRLRAYRAIMVAKGTK